MAKKYSFMCMRLSQFVSLRFIGITLAILVAACSALQPQYPLHGVLVKNVGKTTIKKILIVYGINKLSYATPTGAGGTINYYGENPVPNSFLTSWTTAEDREYTVNIQLKNKLNYIEELRAVELWFDGDKLEVYQATKSGARGEFTNRRRIYPE
jgi:hypothetical protein